MFWFPTKRQVKRAFKIRDEKIIQLEQAIKKQDEKIEELDKKLISRKEAELMIREFLVQSGPNSGPNQTELKPIHPKMNKYERLLVQKAIKTRPEALKQTIKGYFNEGMRTTDIYRLIVEEKRLISKTQFYHYLGLVKTEFRSGLQTELPLEQTEPNRTKLDRTKPRK